MASEILLAGLVNNVAALIDVCHFPSEALVLLEKIPQAVVDTSELQNLLFFSHFNAGIDFAHYTSGRIFHQDFELRWEKNNDNTQVIYLGREQSMPLLQTISSLSLDQCTTRFRQFYLFGRRLDAVQLAQIGWHAVEGNFAEPRISRLLRYPAPKQAQRVQLVVREYIHKQTGELETFRFAGLIAEEGL